MATTVNFYFDARLISVSPQVLSYAIALCFRNIELFYTVTDRAVINLTQYSSAIVRHVSL